MTRLLDVLEDYLHWKGYRYLRLDGHTNGTERGALIDTFNAPDSEAFLFLLSIRAGGVGINLQAADTVILFDTDWNPQVDLQAQARAHRIGQKRDVLVLRLETIDSVEEQVRAAAEHKLGVANQSITAGFFDNNTSAEDRKEYLEGLLRESKKEEDAPVLDDDALNYLLARSDEEIDVFETIDKQRIEEEQMLWKTCLEGKPREAQFSVPPRLLQENELIPLLAAVQSMESEKLLERQKPGLGGVLDTEQYGRGKRAREVKSYGDQLSEQEFEDLCHVEESEPAKKRDPDKGKSSCENKVQFVDAPIVDAVSAHQPPAAKKRGRPRKNASTTISTPSLKDHALIEATIAKSPENFQQVSAANNSEAFRQRLLSNEKRYRGSESAGSQLSLEASYTHQERAAVNLRNLHHAVHGDPLGAFENKTFYHGVQMEPGGPFENKGLGLHISSVSAILALEAPSASEMRSSGLMRENKFTTIVESIPRKRVERTEPSKQDAAPCITLTGCLAKQPSEQPSVSSQAAEQKPAAISAEPVDMSNAVNLKCEDVRHCDPPKPEVRAFCGEDGNLIESTSISTKTHENSAQQVEDADKNQGLTSLQTTQENRTQASECSESLDAGQVAPVLAQQSGSTEVNDTTLGSPMLRTEGGPAEVHDKTPIAPMLPMQDGPAEVNDKMPSGVSMLPVQDGPMKVDEKLTPPSLT